MATAYTPAVAPLGAVALHRTAGAVSGVVAAIRKWNDDRRTVAALRALSPNLLDDIGLTQGDVLNYRRRGL